MTRRIDVEVDLLSAAGADGPIVVHDGDGLAGRGVAARLEIPAPWSEHAAAAAARLRELDVADEVGRPGTGAVAFAALPFDRDRPGELVVPEVVVGRHADGTRWVTGPPDRCDAIVAELSAGARERRDDDERPAEPTCYHLQGRERPEEWRDRVADAAGRIRAGELTKVVLAREVEVSADVDFDRAAILARLAATFGSSMTYGVDGFVGASPELLVGREGDVVRARPMAGTTPRTGSPERDLQRAAALLASPKDRWEHRITIDAVHDRLLAFCSYLDAGTEPEVHPVANVTHLASTVEGRLSAPAASALELAAALHPTPAVGGAPTEEALALMAALEGRDRGRYAGPVGWVDAAGNGRFAVGIRGAELDGNRARVLAGVGVVAGSDPDAELAETRAKFQAILGALVVP